MESPFGTLDDGNLMLSTPQKGDNIVSICNDENQENGTHDRLSKRLKVVDTLTPPNKMTAFDIRPDNRSNPHDDGVSNCGVAARREWLKQFGKQHVSTFPKKNSRKSVELSRCAPPPPPPRGARSAVKSRPPTSAIKPPFKPERDATSTLSAASTLANRLITEPTSRNFTPALIKKARKKEIKATDEGYASVAKLSQWLANDPTSTKKKRHVRMGRNVISKSRQFDKGMEDVIVVENNITRGAVSDRKKWLNIAFGDEEDELTSFHQTDAVTRYAKTDVGAYDAASCISVSDKKDWLKKAFKNSSEEASSSEDNQESEIITDDAASLLSVSDKKNWFKNAFNNTPVKKQGYSSAYPKARSDIIHSRGESRDEIAARAKKRFLARSTHKGTSVTPSKVPRGPVNLGTPQQYQVSRDVNQDTNRQHVQQEANENKEENCQRKYEVEERTGPPSGSIVEPAQNNSSVVELAPNVEEDKPPAGSIVEPAQNNSSVVELAPYVEEDKTPFDFRAARDSLVQRSRKNGNAVQVVNKVYLKKNKFENIEKENKRRSGAFGLLKPSWEHTGPSEGRPSNAYDKKFVADIAPKKSFEELP